MTEQERVKELETMEEYYQRQIALRDKLIIRLLDETEPLCEECALKAVCIGGAKYDACLKGLLAGEVQS